MKASCICTGWVLFMVSDVSDVVLQRRLIERFMNTHWFYEHSRPPRLMFRVFIRAGARGWKNGPDAIIHLLLLLEIYKRAINTQSPNIHTELSLPHQPYSQPKTTVFTFIYVWISFDMNVWFKRHFTWQNAVRSCFRHTNSFLFIRCIFLQTTRTRLSSRLLPSGT